MGVPAQVIAGEATSRSRCEPFREIILGKLDQGLTKADWFDPELTPKIQSFCKHYHTVILPTRPRMPRHKGKLIGDVPSATAILDRFLQHAEVITITGRSYRLRNKSSRDEAAKEQKKPRKDKGCPEDGQ